MPRKPPKALRWKKVRENRVVYVSWRVSEQPQDYTQWINIFWNRLRVHRSAFVGLMRTGEAEAATLLNKRLEESKITDVIAVLTDVYLNDNLDDDAAKGELVRFFRDALKSRTRGQSADTDLETPIEFFLAPLDPPTWSVRIGNVSLDDPRLRRIRPARFSWPSDSNSKVADEVADAVNKIVSDARE